MSLYYFRQPNGANVDITIYGESMSAYEEKDFLENPDLRGMLTANVLVYYDYDSSMWHTHRKFDKRFYFDNKGVYSYKNQKTPIFYWKVTNVEEEYKHWHKTPEGYSIPLNEPRLLKKNIF